MNTEDLGVILLGTIFLLLFVAPLWYIEITGPNKADLFLKPVTAICGRKDAIMGTKKSTPPYASAPQYLKKITTKHVGLKTQVMEEIALKAKESAGEPVPVAVLRVYGRVRSATQGQGQYGPWTKFGGEFEAVNQVTRDVFRSTFLCLPSMGEQILNDMLDSRDDTEAWVQFAVDVTVLYNESSKGGTRFSYGVQPLLESTQPRDDILTMLGAKLPEPKALLP